MFVLRSDLRHVYTAGKNWSKLAEKVVQSKHSQPFTQEEFWHSSDEKHIMDPIWNMLLVLYWCTDQCSCELACIFSQKDQRSICIIALDGLGPMFVEFWGDRCLWPQSTPKKTQV